MEINTSGALISGAVSGLIAFGAAFFAQKRLSSSVEGKAQRFLLNAGFISAALGLMSILNELLSFMLLGLQIREDKIISALLIYIAILPGALGLVLWTLKSRKNKPAPIPDASQYEISAPTNAEAKSQSPNQGLNSKNILLIGFIVVLAITASQMSAILESLNKDKTFKTSDCRTCDSTGFCQDLDMITGFKVEAQDVIIFVKVDGKEQFYSATPKSEKCTIVKDRNFAFTCNDFTDLGYGFFMSQKHEFDGKNTFQMTTQSKAILNGKPLNTLSKNTCQVR